jgi:hypothetical protein
VKTTASAVAETIDRTSSSVPITVVHRLELAAVHRNARRREQAHPAAQLAGGR